MLQEVLFLNNTEKWEKSLCRKCLGCERLEDLKFLGVNHCLSFVAYEFKPELSYKQLKIEVNEC